MRKQANDPKRINFLADFILYWLCLADFIEASFLSLTICLKYQNFRRIKPYLKKDSLSASFISCTKLLNAPFPSRLRNNSRTHFFLFLSFFFFILNKTASCKNKISSSSESDMIANELQNPYFIFYSQKLMTDVSRVFVKYRRKIIVKYRHRSPFIA